MVLGWRLIADLALNAPVVLFGLAPLHQRYKPVRLHFYPVHQHCDDAILPALLIQAAASNALQPPLLNPLGNDLEVVLVGEYESMSFSTN